LSSAERIFTGEALQSSRVHRVFMYIGL